MNRRAFLSAIAGAVVAPHVRVAAQPEPRILVTSEWLWEMGHDLHPWEMTALELRKRDWQLNLALNCVSMPLSDARKLAVAYAERVHADYQRLGFIGLRFSSQLAPDARIRGPHIILDAYREA